MRQSVSLLDKVKGAEGKAALMQLISALGCDPENKVLFGQLDGFRKMVRLLVEGDENLRKQILKTLQLLLEVQSDASTLAESAPLGGGGGAVGDNHRARADDAVTPTPSLAAAAASSGSLASASTSIGSKLSNVVLEVTKMAFSVLSEKIGLSSRGAEEKDTYASYAKVIHGVHFPPQRQDIVYVLELIANVESEKRLKLLRRTQASSSYSSVQPAALSASFFSSSPISTSSVTHSDPSLVSDAPPLSSSAPSSSSSPPPPHTEELRCEGMGIGRPPPQSLTSAALTSAPLSVAAGGGSDSGRLCSNAVSSDASSSSTLSTGGVCVRPSAVLDIAPSEPSPLGPGAVRASRGVSNPLPPRSPASARATATDTDTDTGTAVSAVSAVSPAPLSALTSAPLPARSSGNHIVAELVRAQAALVGLGASISQAALSVQLDLMETISKLLLQNPNNQAEFHHLDGYAIFWRLLCDISDFSAPHTREFLQSCFDVVFTLALDNNPSRLVGNTDALVWLVRTVADRRQHAEVRYQAMQCLSELISFNPLNSVFVKHYHGVDALLSVLQTYAHHSYDCRCDAPSPSLHALALSVDDVMMLVRKSDTVLKYLTVTLSNYEVSIPSAYLRLLEAAPFPLPGVKMVVLRSLSELLSHFHVTGVEVEPADRLVGSVLTALRPAVSELQRRCGVTEMMPSFLRPDRADSSASASASSSSSSSLSFTLDSAAATPFSASAPLSEGELPRDTHSRSVPPPTTLSSASAPAPPASFTLPTPSPFHRCAPSVTDTACLTEQVALLLELLGHELFWEANAYLSSQLHRFVSGRGLDALCSLVHPALPDLVVEMSLLLLRRSVLLSHFAVLAVSVLRSAANGTPPPAATPMEATSRSATPTPAFSATATPLRPASPLSLSTASASASASSSASGTAPSPMTTTTTTTTTTTATMTTFMCSPPSLTAAPVEGTGSHSASPAVSEPSLCRYFVALLDQPATPKGLRLRILRALLKTLQEDARVQLSMAFSPSKRCAHKPGARAHLDSSLQRDLRLSGGLLQLLSLVQSPDLDIASAAFAVLSEALCCEENKAYVGAETGFIAFAEMLKMTQLPLNDEMFHVVLELATVFDRSGYAFASDQRLSLDLKQVAATPRATFCPQNVPWRKASCLSSDTLLALSYRFMRLGSSDSLPQVFDDVKISAEILLAIDRLSHPKLLITHPLHTTS